LVVFNLCANGGFSPPIFKPFRHGTHSGVDQNMEERKRRAKNKGKYEREKESKIKENEKEEKRNEKEKKKRSSGR
jgi:hypothetical protein